jgi:outer membrane protein TolC
MKRLHYAIVAPAVAFLSIAGAPAAGALPQSPSTTPSTAAASAPQGAPLTLPQAIQEALDNNQRLAVAAAAVDEAEAGTRQASAHKLPRVDVSYLFQRTNNPVFVFGNLLRQGNFSEANFDINELNNPDPINNFTPSVNVVQPIWTGGRISRREEAAELNVEAAGLQQARTRQQVVYDTVEAYSGAVLASRHLAVAEEAQTTAEAHVALAESMRQGGLVVDSDVLQARVRASEAREAVVRARSGLAVAKTALNFVIGRDLSAPVALPEALDETAAAEENLDDLVATALATRPDLRATAVQEQAVGKNIDAEKANFMPEVAVSGFAESSSDSMFGSQSGNWGVMVGANFTVFDGNARSAAVEGGLAQRRQIQQQALLLRRAIALEVTKAYYDVQAAGERIVQAETAVELARENQRLVENRYREGMSTSVELLDAQTQLTRAQTRVVAARRDLMLGRAALDLAVGR